MHTLTPSPSPQDQAATPQSSTAILTVQVQDADDQNPAFTRDHYMAVLPEDPTKVTTRTPAL